MFVLSLSRYYMTLHYIVEFFFRYEYAWTAVSGNLRIRLRHYLGSSLHGEHYKQTWRTAEVVASLLVALIASLISRVQIKTAVINLHNQYIRHQQDVLRLLSINSGHYKVKKRANHHRRRFWTRAGRTSAWWDNFINDTMIEEEWRENFRMCKRSLVKLAEELRPYIEGKETVMRFPVDVFSSDKLQASTVYTSQ